MTVAEAVRVRRSVRVFSMESLDRAFFTALSDFADGVKTLTPDPGYRIRVVDTKEFSGMFSGRFAVRAPYYLLFYADKSLQSGANIGYIAQQLVLYLTTQKIGTLYLGSLKPLCAKYDGLFYTLAVAFGKTDLPPGRPGSAKRRPLNRLFTGVVTDKARPILEAGRLAPSAFNRQPWFFDLSPGSIEVYRRKPPFGNSRLGALQQIDIGICLANMHCVSEDWTIARLPEIGAAPKGYVPEYKIYKG